MPRIRNATAIQPNAQQSREKEPAQSTLHEASIPPKKTLCRIWYPYRTLYGIVAIIVQAICVAIITQYSPSPTDPVRHPLPRHICFPGFVSLLNNLFVQTKSSNGQISMVPVDGVPQFQTQFFSHLQLSSPTQS